MNRCLIQSRLWGFLLVATGFVYLSFLVFRVFAVDPCQSYAKTLACPTAEPIECEDYNQQACNNNNNPIFNRKLFIDKWSCFPTELNLICLPRTQNDGSAATEICWRSYRCRWDPLAGRCVAVNQPGPFSRSPVYFTVDCDTGWPIDINW